jgi:hypothetical protein
MSSGFEIFENSSISKIDKEYKFDKILNKFFPYLKETQLEEKYIMLWPFVDTIPLKYIKPEAYEKLFLFFSNNVNATTDAILEHDFDMTKAILTFFNIHAIMHKEDSIGTLSPETMYNFDTVYHFEYIKNIEHVYGRLINIVASTLEKANGKNYTSQANLSNKIDILQSNDLGVLTECCNTTIRNAISHGTVYYDSNQIIFINKNNEERLFPYEYIKIIDDLMDTCSSILLSLIYFIICNDKILLSHNISSGIMFIYLSPLLGSNYYKYISIMTSCLPENKQQINFFVKTDSNSRSIHCFESYRLAYFLNTRFSHKFSRMGVSIDSGNSIKPSIFINLEIFQNLIKEDKFSDLGKTIDTNLLWHDESKFRERKWINKSIFFYHIENIKKYFVKEIYEKAGLNYYGDRCVVKHIEDRSSEKIGRIFIHIVITKDIKDVFDDIEKFIEMLLSFIKKYKRRRDLKINGFSDRTTKVKPIYIWGSLYKQDVRNRSLHLNNNKICDFEWIRNDIKYAPILLKDINKTKGLRIRFFN